MSHAGWQYAPYSLKITKEESLTYEDCKYYSPSGQISFSDEDDEEYEDYTEEELKEELEYKQKVYDKYWNHYFGNI